MILELALTLALSSTSALACNGHACGSDSCSGKKEVFRATASAPTGGSTASSTHGKGVTLKEPPLSLTEALEKKESLKGKEILVKAEVGQVCQSKGCWIMLKDGENQVRVTFANYSFFVPKDSAKREAVVQGKIFDKKISASEARHYAKDAGMPADEVKKIKEGTTSPWFEATGLTLNETTL